MCLFLQTCCHLKEVYSQKEQKFQKINNGSLQFVYAEYTLHCAPTTDECGAYQYNGTDGVCKLSNESAVEDGTAVNSDVITYTDIKDQMHYY